MKLSGSSSHSRPNATAQRARFAVQRPGWDALLLAVLLIARLRINSLAEATLFEHFQNVTQHPILGRLLSDQAEAAFGPWLGDPIALLLAALSLAALVAYLIVDLAARPQAQVQVGVDTEQANRHLGRMLAYRPKRLSENRSRTPSPGAEIGPRTGLRAGFRIGTKLILLWAIIFFAVLAPTIKLAMLRHDNLPQSYSHDGGVIQTEVTIDYFLSGRNPYVEDYRQTPMAEWGFPEFRTALDHYPYLPWTFVFSAPFKVLSMWLLGWYDQRFVYLLLFVAGLILASRLLPGQRPRQRLAMVAILGLNPIMGLDLIFGQNDVFVWAWLVLALWLVSCSRYGAAAAGGYQPDGGSGTRADSGLPHPETGAARERAFRLKSPSENRSRTPSPGAEIGPRTGLRAGFRIGSKLALMGGSGRGRSGRVRGATDGWLLLGAAAFGLGCASKPTAWFLAPFFALLLVSDRARAWRDLPSTLGLLLRRGWPAVAVFGLLVGPYLAWDPNAFVDDVWRWAAGTAKTHYQIWGWGASNFVLAFGGLSSRFDYWPFWIPELVVSVPLLWWLMRRQLRCNELGAACWHYGLLLLAFLYVSRFLNENYLGYILAFLTMGYFMQPESEGP